MSARPHPRVISPAGVSGAPAFANTPRARFVLGAGVRPWLIAGRRRSACGFWTWGGRPVPPHLSLSRYRTGLIWPRISPFGFFEVWTFTYVLPAFSGAIWACVSVTVPLAGDVHGPQRPTRTPAATCRAAGPWMCAAFAGPLRCVNVSVYVRVVPFSVAVKR